jgi:hypothetical protein
MNLATFEQGVMAMRELLEAIKQVRERIKRYENQLSQNEMMTRYALVDPILRALGWNTEDPGQVVPDFSTQRGRADYALKWNGKPHIIVEVKSLGNNLNRAAMQGVNYCVAEGISYFVCTDGNKWEVYNAFLPVPMKEKLIVKVSVSDEQKDDTGGAVARQLLALWRPAMPEVAIAPQPIVMPPEEIRERKEEERQKGLPLPELLKQMQPRQKPPAKIYFPDGTEKVLERWKGLLVAVAKWVLPKLQKSGKLPLGSLIKLNGLREPREVGDGWYVETYFSAKNCVHNSIRLLKEAGIPPEQVRVL